jgi:asparagine N-glycosylation enzyme membrane subunit Stt3
MQVPFVGFQPIQTSEHMAALGVFGLLQLVAAVEWVRAMVPGKQFKLLLRGFLVVAAILGAGAISFLTSKGWIRGWTGRFYSLFDTGYVGSGSLWPVWWKRLLIHPLRASGKDPYPHRAFRERQVVTLRTSC